MKTEVKIPVEEIMAQYYEYMDEIMKRCAAFAAKEIKNNAKIFEMLSLSGTMGVKWWNNSGNLRKGIKAKKSHFNKEQYVAGATSPHAHLLEYGHVKWLWGKNTGEHVPAAPFVRPAEEKTIAELGSIIKQVLDGKKIIVGGGN